MSRDVWPFSPGHPYRGTSNEPRNVLEEKQSGEPARMAKRSDYDRTEKTIATEEPARAEEAQRVIQEYINDLREIL
jgi:hypothetical protein